MNIKRRNVLKVAFMMSTAASMLLSACGTSSTKDVNEQPPPPSNPGASQRDNEGNTKQAKDRKSGGETTPLPQNPSKKKSKENGANENCELVELGNRSFIDVVIARLGQDWRNFSKCETVKSPPAWERAYQATFSEKDVIISNKKPREASDMNEEKLVRLEWREINRPFLVVLNAATEMAKESMEGKSGTDEQLSVFESSFPATPVQRAKIPGTAQLSESNNDYSGLSYTTINKDHVYWTIQHEIDLANNRQTDLIVYQPADSKRPALARFLNPN